MLKYNFWLTNTLAYLFCNLFHTWDEPPSSSLLSQRSKFRNEFLFLELSIQELLQVYCTVWPWRIMDRSHMGEVLLATSEVWADLKNKKKERKVQNWNTDGGTFHFSVVWQMESPFCSHEVGYEGRPVIHPRTWQISCLLEVWVIFFLRKIWRWNRPSSSGKHTWALF